MPDLPDLGDWYQAAGLLGLAAGSFVIALSGALMPGPLLVAAVREGARQGHRAGPLLTLGHGVLEAAAAVLIYLFLAAADFLNRDKPFAAVAFVGALLLLAMGLLMLRGAGRASAASLTEVRDKDAPGRRRMAAAGAVLAGAVVSLSNPFWSTWWVTVGLACIVLVKGLKLGWAGLAVFFAGHIAADLAWYWLITYTASRGRRLLSDRSYRALIVACALFLIGFAGWFLYQGAARMGWAGQPRKPLHAARP